MNALDISSASDRHPCFNKKAAGSCGRIHLPVAPACNIMCRYCNRKYDCVNESRPGVTSGVLTPQAAADYLDQVLAKEPRITVVGIAGPGDPMADAEKTLATVRLIHERHPEMLFCMSTNGLALPAHVDELAELGVSHLTVTVNAVDPEIGQNFYRFVRDGKVVYRGREAAELLLSRQLEGIRRAKAHGLVVKVNMILTPGVNDHHVEDVAKTMAELGVDLLNVMPLHPTAGTDFADLPEPGPERLEELRSTAEQHIPQMRHCKRCRADAVGLLDQDRSGEFAGCLSACASKVKTATDKTPTPADSKPYVAVASREGLLVNQHLGEADKFQIWAEDPNGGYQLVTEREAPPTGGGIKRWKDLAASLADCRMVLVSGVGDTPRIILEEYGVPVIAMSGFIDQGLEAAFTGSGMDSLRIRASGGCASGGCRGTGEGC